MTPAAFRASLARLKITQAFVARVLGVHVRTVNDWATGNNGVPRPVAILLTLAVDGRLSITDIERAHLELGP
jgi:DNA-binding transcriptional regulator YiaG